MTGRSDRTRRWLRRHGMPVLMLLIVLGGSVLYVVSAARLNAATQCQAEFNAAFSAALAERSAAAARERATAREERAANRDLIRTILENADDPEARRQALVNYVATSEATDRAEAEADASRARHPLPRDACQMTEGTDG